MAYIPSWQELREHPKTVRAARALDVRRTSVIGMLHCLWWWALDYASDGDLTGFDDADIAAAAEWEGDPAAFVAALAGCGVAGRPGFLDRHETGYGLHDWGEYGGRFVEQRARDAQRKRDVRATSGGRPADSGRTAGVEELRQEEIRRTRSTPTSLRVDVQGDPGPEFAPFWDAYPPRNGKREGKAKAAAIWDRMTATDRTLATVAVSHYAAACAAGLTKAADAFRWLRDRRWTEWQTPATPDPTPQRLTANQQRQAELYTAAQEAAARLHRLDEIGPGP